MYIAVSSVVIKGAEVWIDECPCSERKRSDGNQFVMLPRR